MSFKIRPWLLSSKEKEFYEALKENGIIIDTYGELKTYWQLGKEVERNDRRGNVSPSRRGQEENDDDYEERKKKSKKRVSKYSLTSIFKWLLISFFGFGLLLVIVLNVMRSVILHEREILAGIFIFCFVGVVVLILPDVLSFFSQLVLRTEPPEVREAFAVFDRDGDGYISMEDLKLVMVDFEKKISDREIFELFLRFDVDCDGRLNLQEFHTLLKNSSL